MSTPYIGEIRMFGGNFAPLGWAFCQGQIMAIDANTALFQLIGTTYGGDGVTTFALPDLRGRIPIHQGTGGGGSYVMGQSGGAESVTLTVNQLPSHTHPIVASATTTTASSPGNAVLAHPSTLDLYRPATVPDSAMNSNSITLVGGNQPHGNMQPFLCVNFIIALEGVFPSQN